MKVGLISLRITSRSIANNWLLIMGYKYNYFTSHFHGLTKVDNDIALDPLTGVIHALGLVQLNLEVDQLPHPASVPWPLDLVKRLL